MRPWDEFADWPRPRHDREVQQAREEFGNRALGMTKSDLVILHVDEPTAPPAATVHPPQRVPHGFHGNWIPNNP